MLDFPDGCFEIAQKINELEKLTKKFAMNQALYLDKGNNLCLIIANETITSILIVYNSIMTKIERVIHEIASD